ncbi:MAG: HPr(Ser) kinase/phosphatase [Oscillospiraceae bacterium]|jgi:HPr kinase/phosphorylase|nr:HPr(Ser) kinase/phosphatase [Oscillospiraceae bacterium]
MIYAEDFVKSLNLTILVPSGKKGWDLKATDMNRPGMQLAGFYEYFPHDGPQVIGKVEMRYLDTLTSAVRRQRLEKFMSYDIPCIIISRGMRCPQDLEEMAKKRDIGVYQSQLTTMRFVSNAILYLNAQLAPRQTLHGVLVNVYGVGILLTGESGVGKSESALELVKRGHQLVADDVVDVRKVTEHRLVGEAPEIVRHFMEIRGIGIIDIRAMYGIGSVILSKTVDLVINLETWVKDRAYDRLGLTEEHTTIMGVIVPYMLIPVQPGRNLAIVIEVAARNFTLKRTGYNAAVELDKRLVSLSAVKAEDEYVD